MIRRFRTMRGSTLAETLVMMIVAGAIFLSVMDGLRLFHVLLVRRTQAIGEAGRIREGYRRMEALVTGADSVGESEGVIYLFRGGEQTEFRLADSSLVCRNALSCDTLLRPAERMRLIRGGGTAADTVAVGCRSAGEVLWLRFPVPPRLERRYREELKRIEEGYGYEK